MSAQKFKVGQEVVCVVNGESWEILSGTKREVMRPKKNEIYTVRETVHHLGVCWISLMEFPEEYVFDQEYFEPVIRIDDLKAILEQQPEEEPITQTLWNQKQNLHLKN